MLSIVIILIGILAIIFIQFDRGYVLNHSQTDFDNAQRNLINHFYQTQLSEQETTKTPLNKKKQHDTTEIQSDVITENVAPASQQDTKPANHATPPRPLAQEQLSALDQIRNNNSIWQQRQAQNQYENDYQMRLLRNNPWSPYYQPEKR